MVLYRLQNRYTQNQPVSSLRKNHPNSHPGIRPLLFLPPFLPPPLHSLPFWFPFWFPFPHLFPASFLASELISCHLPLFHRHLILLQKVSMLSSMSSIFSYTLSSPPPDVLLDSPLYFFIHDSNHPVYTNGWKFGANNKIPTVIIQDIVW